MRSIAASVVMVIGSLVAALPLGGCNNCEKMTEKLCNDLGQEDCAVWKRNGLDQSFIPTGRGVNKACGMMMSDAAYPKVLEGARQQVAAARKAEQAKAQAQRH